MFQLLYVSTAVKPFTSDELLQLLGKARPSNEELGITGMLLYKNMDFMQALEGQQAQVEALAARIAKDPRHKGVQIIWKGSSKDREFPDWTMGFSNLDAIAPQDVPGYSTFLDSPLRSHTFTDNPAYCRSLLLLFKAKPQKVVVKAR
jgi:hypothetical protein